MTELPRHFIVADLGFGDAGKGQTVDRLCRLQPVNWVIRYNGGCQAGHNVHTADGRHHCFSQFGAGTFAGVPTFLSRFMIVEPYSMAIEATALMASGINNPHELLTIEASALVTTPYHWTLNRARENARASNAAGRHGSVGRGVGATREFALLRPHDALRVGDVLNPASHRYKLGEIRKWAHDTLLDFDRAATRTATFLPDVDDVLAHQAHVLKATKIVTSDWLPTQLDKGINTVWEGAQGVLLDETYGFYPHTTWTDTTMRNANTLLAEAGQTGYRLGVLRTYMVRHGAGPLPTEMTLGTPEPDNPTNPWQESIRTGYFDAALFRYAVNVLWETNERSNYRPSYPLDGVCLTHIDTAIAHDLRVVDHYRRDGKTWDLPIGDASLESRRALGWALTRKDTFDWAIGGPMESAGRWTSVVSKMLGAPVVIEGLGPTTYKVNDKALMDNRIWNSWQDDDNPQRYYTPLLPTD